MQYFYDFEFHEDGKTIEPISLGVVAQDGREFYRIFTDFDTEKAWNNEWLRDNVLLNMWEDSDASFYGTHVINHTLENFKDFIARHPKAYPRPKVKEQLLEFFGEDKNIELWGYYSDYDHVCLAQLWGKMIDLPPRLPMLTYDLKQELDMKKITELPPQSNEHHALADAKWIKQAYNSTFALLWQDGEWQKAEPFRLFR